MSTLKESPDAPEVGDPSKDQKPLLLSLKDESEGLKADDGSQETYSSAGEKFDFFEAVYLEEDAHPPEAHVDGPECLENLGKEDSVERGAISQKAVVKRVDISQNSGKEAPLLRALDSGQEVLLFEAGSLIGPSRSHQEPCIIESSAAQDVSSLEDTSNGSIDVVPFAKSGEKRAGNLLAVTIRKYAVPKSSCYHGVTKLKWSGKYEAHLWDNTSRVEGSRRKGKHGTTHDARKRRRRKQQSQKNTQKFYVEIQYGKNHGATPQIHYQEEPKSFQKTLTVFYRSLPPSSIQLGSTIQQSSFIKNHPWKHSTIEYLI